jgi:hypothetical protein
MLPVPHFQVVFTVPAALRPLAAMHPDWFYPLLLRTAASLVQDVGQERLGAQVGITAVLHTWDRQLRLHPHVHLLVTAGGLSPDGTRWVSVDGDYLFPDKVLGQRFRGRLLEQLIAGNAPGGALGLDEADRRKLAETLRDVARRTRRGWVVHTEPPRGRTAAQVTKYLARYVGRVAISDPRIHEVTDTHVTFLARRGLVTVDGPEFVRRFSLHVLPPGLRRVRHSGLYAPGAVRDRLARARALVAPLDAVPSAAQDAVELADAFGGGGPGEACPHCKLPWMVRIHSNRPPPKLLQHWLAMGLPIRAPP